MWFLIYVVSVIIGYLASRSFFKMAIENDGGVELSDGAELAIILAISLVPLIPILNLVCAAVFLGCVVHERTKRRFNNGSIDVTGAIRKLFLIRKPKPKKERVK